MSRTLSITILILQDGPQKKETAITVFGFHPDNFDAVLRQFEMIGPISCFTERTRSRQNFIHIDYMSPADAHRVCLLIRLAAYYIYIYIYYILLSLDDLLCLIL